MFWAVSALAWAGSMRIGELLAEFSTRFDPALSLLGKDMEVKDVMVEGGLKVSCVRLYIKSRKETASWVCG